MLKMFAVITYFQDIFKQNVRETKFRCTAQYEILRKIQYARKNVCMKYLRLRKCMPVFEEDAYFIVT